MDGECKRSTFSADGNEWQPTDWEWFFHLCFFYRAAYINGEAMRRRTHNNTSHAQIIMPLIIITSSAVADALNVMQPSRIGKRGKCAAKMAKENLSKRRMKDSIFLRVNWSRVVRFSKRVRNRRDYRRFSCLIISIGTEGNKHASTQTRTEESRKNLRKIILLM